MKKRLLIFILTVFLLIIPVSVVYAEDTSIDYDELVLVNEELSTKVASLEAQMQLMLQKSDDYIKSINIYSDLINDYKILVASSIENKAESNYTLQDVKDLNEFSTKSISWIIGATSIAFGFFFVVGGIVIPYSRKKLNDKIQKNIEDTQIKILDKQIDIENEYRSKIEELSNQMDKNEEAYRTKISGLKIQLKQNEDSYKSKISELTNRTEENETKLRKDFKTELEVMATFRNEIEDIKETVEAFTKEAEEASEEAKLSSVISESYSLQSNNKFEEALLILDRIKFDDDSK